MRIDLTSLDQISAIIDWGRAVFSSPPITAAVIAAFVALIVAWQARRQGNQARQSQLAKTLLNEVYGPMYSFLQNKCLYEYVSEHKTDIQENLFQYSTEIRSILEQAISDHFRRPLDFGVDEQKDAQEKSSREKLKSLEGKLTTSLRREIEKLQNLANK